MEFDDPYQLIASLRLRAEESWNVLTHRDQPAIVLACVALTENSAAHLHGYARLGLYGDNGRFDLDQIRAHLRWLGRNVQSDAVFALIVDGHGPCRRHPCRDYSPVLAEISALAHYSGCGLAHAWHVPSLDPGSSWTSLTASNRSGVITGPPTPDADTQAVFTDRSPRHGSNIVSEQMLLEALEFLVERVRSLDSGARPRRV
ncbi:DUF4192 family protein [Nocardia cyriacigeorgica]|uniref:DUF4192 family protein n=1 Tax=Nocardia cyriacigeorgica TaxID=135487 RepID=A0A6P1CNP4_9NOCA|nr:DUF4192 family protein [Nocardia cyriacigeorgica]MBF6496521.1 DUF4192 family protein [Nocardia cyriacigeorgica]NEW32806.1 DUF4192 family protein [Nocardia cyriacigeorgica]